MKKGVLIQLIVAGSLLSIGPAFSQTYIAGFDVAKEEVLRSIPVEYINKARTELVIAYQHTSHGTHVSRGVFGLQDYKTGDTLLFGVSESANDTTLEFRDYALEDYAPPGVDGIDLSVDETAFIQTTRNYLDAPENATVNVIMWAWCDIAGHDPDINYLPGMDDLISEYGPGGSKIGTGVGQREIPVSFIYMTGHANEDDNTGPYNPMELAKMITDSCNYKQQFCLDYYSIDTHDMDDNYYEDASDDGDSDIYGGNFYHDWQDSHILGEHYYENKTSPGGSVDYGEHNSQHITANRKAYAFWWILARIAGWEDCATPADWDVNPADFAFTGQVTAKVFLDDVAAESGYLAAFVGDECRSMPVEASYFLPGDHFVFDLICYSNVASGEILTFKYFDDTNCEILEPFGENLEFTSDMIVSDAEFPFELHYPVEIPMDLSFTVGWNWFSLNLLTDDMTLGNILTCATENDYIKNQTSSATYFDAGGWYGSILDAGGLDPLSMYKIKTINPCGGSYLGVPVDVLDTPINIVPGWNWISYLPQCSIPIAEALDSMELETGIFIKNHSQSSTYYDSFGWFGALKELVPGEGYMLKKESADTLIYPECPPVSSGAKKAASVIQELSISSLDPHQFEFNGSITAQVHQEGFVLGSENDLVFAYVNGQLRGAIHGIYFEPSESYAFPLMVFSNLVQGEIIHFRYYSATKDLWYECEETLVFHNDMIVSDALAPFQLNVNTASGGIEESIIASSFSLEAYPNPFQNQIRIDYTIAKNSKVQLVVYDMLGKMVEKLDEGFLDPGSYSLDWNAEAHPEGSYLLKLSTEHTSAMKRIILMR